MELCKVLKERRTVRRFRQESIPDEEIFHLIDMARRASCGKNAQQLRYVVARSPEKAAAIFPHTAWAGAVTPRRDPVPGATSPTAFIAVTAPAGIAALPLTQTDCGAAIQTLQLAAWEKGIGCCWMGAIDRKAIHEILGLADDTAILYIVALGYAAEHPVSDEIDDPEKTSYYLDDEDVIHVPKLSVDVLTQWQ